MNCPQCGTESPEGAKFCLECGAKLGIVCLQCGVSLPPQAKFCSECGAPVGPPHKVGELPTEDILTEALQRLAPTGYAERLLATRGQVAHERRTVTILFCDVKGSTAMAERLDPEDVLEIMDGAFDVLIEPVYRHEGTLARLMGDAVLAFFGAPIAHEDDPERAIRAALEITARAQEYAEELERDRGISGFNVRVGIHTGLVVVGEVGSDLRVEYTAMGDAVNLAARMEQNAPPGGILITHDTYRHVRGVFDVEPQEPFHVKGRAEPVQTYLVQRAKARAFRKPMRGVEGIETRMVGREAELKHLQEAFYTVMEDGELQMVTISGEAGVGKSRLLHEFDIWAEALSERFYYFRGRAIPEMRHQPYGLIRNLVAFRFQIRESDPAGMVREKLEVGVRLPLGEDENSQSAAHLIGRLLGFEIGESTHLEAVQDDAQAIRDQALGHLSDYFKGMAAQLPVLILLEDLHWADDSSLDTLNHLAQALISQPLMVVGAARPELFERRPHWGEGQPFHTRQDLQRLSKWDSRHLVAEILQKMEHVPGTLRDLVVRGAEGNPFFIEELIKMLVEDGVILKGEERWRLEPSRLAEIRVPPTLTGVLQARLDRLPPEERAVLQQASVVGRLFWDRAVARINESVAEEIEKTRILDRLSALRGREMVFQRETSAFADAQEYLFKHALLREVTYESVLKRVRRVYHGLVGDWLLEQAGERVEEYTSLIADHLALAGRTEEAVEYLLQAGDRARGLYAHQEAIQAYERALALLKAEEDHTRAARTLMKLGLTYHNAFAFRRSRQAYEEGFGLWQRASEAQPVILPPPAPHALRVLSATAVTLDSARTSLVNSTRVIEQLFCGLVELSPEMDVMPDVAQSWEMLEGGRKYVFHLRDNVVWSDGVPVTAYDFEYGWKRVLDPSLGSPVAELLHDLRGARAFHAGQGDAQDLGVRAVGEGTLVVELERPVGYFLQLLACTAAFPVPRHVLEAHGEVWTNADQIVTNGPFRLASWQPQESLVLVRNPSYHGRFDGNVETVELTFRSGREDKVLQMYEEARFDAIDMEDLPSPEFWERARQRHAGDYVRGPVLESFYICFDVSQPPFNDRRVRRALGLATDRESLADIVMRGYKAPVSGGLVPPGMPGHSPGIALPYDPERARGLLAEAGWSGRRFPVGEFLDANIPFWTSVGDSFSRQWREHLGIEINAKRIAPGKMVDAVLSKEASMWILGWTADYPDPDSFLRVLPWSTMTGWKNETFDSLVETARRAMDQEERIRQYREADRILIEEAPIVPFAYGRSNRLVKPWVRKFPISARGGWFWKDVVIEPH